MGAGKSTIGRQLAKALHRKFYDSDKVIEKRTGVSISWIFEMEGESGFRDRESKAIDELTDLKKVVVATGGVRFCLNKIVNGLKRVARLFIYLHRQSNYIDVQPEIKNVPYYKTPIDVNKLKTYSQFEILSIVMWLILL